MRMSARKRGKMMKTMKRKEEEVKKAKSKEMTAKRKGMKMKKRKMMKMKTRKKRAKIVLTSHALRPAVRRHVLLIVLR